MKAIIKIVIFLCTFFAYQQGLKAQSYNLGEAITEVVLFMGADKTAPSCNLGIAIGPKYDFLHLNGSHTQRNIPKSAQQNILVRNIPEYLIEEPCLYRVEKYSYAGTQMNEKALQDFLENNDPELYRKYIKSRRMKIAGWSLFGGGFAVVLTGGLCHLDNSAINAGIGLWSCGIAAVITSLPFICTGYEFNLLESFNNHTNPSKIRLSLTTNMNSVGLALNF